MPGDLDSFDIAGAAASIGSDLFGGSAPDAGDGGAPAAPAAQPAEQTPAPPAPAPAPPSPPEPWRAMPKAWKKEMESIYGSLTPEAMQYIHEREGNVSRGFQQYQSSHENWTKLTTPFQDILSQHPDVNPVELMGSLMQTHLNLMRGTPEQKQAIAQQLLQVYGINMGQAPEQSQALAALQSRLDAYEQREQKAQQQRYVQEVTTFMNDAANKHAKEVVNEMIPLLRQGMDFKTAYEQACWLNPTVRANLIAEQSAAASKTAADADALNKGAPNGTPPTAPRKAKTWEEGVDQIAAKFTSGPKH